MGALPKHNTQIQLNHPILASTAKAKLGALFYNCQDSMILHLTFDKLGHTQPPTLVHCNNSTAISIANDTVKKNSLILWKRTSFGPLIMLP